MNVNWSWRETVKKKMLTYLELRFQVGVERQEERKNGVSDKAGRFPHFVQRVYELRLPTRQSFIIEQHIKVCVGMLQIEAGE